MNERVSRLVADWLAHRTGIAQAIVVTVAWFLFPALAGWSWMAAVFWYLAFCTFISFATQFTIAYQNSHAERDLELALRNLTDLMRLVVALAEGISHDQEEISDELHELTEAVVPLVDPPLGGKE